MKNDDAIGWKRLVAGYPWFAGDGDFPLPAYSEFMPPPRLGRFPYGTIDTLFSDDDAYGWRVTEVEQEYEIRPGLENIARQVMAQLRELGHGMPAHHIAGHRRRNLEANPYWPAEIAGRAGHLNHERYVALLPLALSRTQDDMGRVRWTFFGGSEQGPERAFWKSFYSAPGVELPAQFALSFISDLLRSAYQEEIKDESQLARVGFRIFPSPVNSRFAYLNEKALPTWTRPYVVAENSSFDDVKYLLTFAPFSSLPETVRRKYLIGKLHLLPFPGSLVFWGIPVYLNLQKQLPFGMQLPLQRLVARHDGPDGMRVPQSGWLHEPRRDKMETELQAELLLNDYRRTNRWNRVHRNEDGAAKSRKADKVARILFSTSLDAIDLYDKPMARNCQLWRENGELILDGPGASHEEIERAAAEVVEGGIFRYRFQFPGMRVGKYEVYWHRPLVAFLPHDGTDVRLLDNTPAGYLTAYHAGMANLSDPIELFPRLLRRETYLSALRYFETSHDHYAHETALNIISLLDTWEALDKQPLQRSFASHLIRTAKREGLDNWLSALPDHVTRHSEAPRVRQTLESLLMPDQTLPDAITFKTTATRAYEEAYWNDIVTLSHGRFVNKDNADVVQDPPTLSQTAHHHRDLKQLGEYLIERHRHAIAAAGMEGKAVVGELPFRWQTDFDFSSFGGWKLSQEGHELERNILIMIPGKNRNEAVILGDHYDTAYMEDVYDKSRGGSGARLAAPGADDNHSATATLLQAAPIFLRLAKEGKLERDVWLLHITGEEFPADSLGTRHFCQSLVERNLRLQVDENELIDLSAVRLVGVYVMDMIAHNRENAQDIFQISPGRNRESLRLAYEAHIANMIWNEKVPEWNTHSGRQERGKRTTDGVTVPDIARHPELDGQVRTHDDPQSSLYNTDCQIFSDVGVPVVLFMENYDIDRTGYHDTKDTMENIDLDYGAALSAIAIETIARVAALAKI